jgi:hypothetical protein
MRSGSKRVRRVAGCPLCLAPFQSTVGLRQHVARVHGLPAGSRLASIAVELSVARARGWPAERFEREPRVLTSRGELFVVSEGVTLQPVEGKEEEKRT